MPLISVNELNQGASYPPRRERQRVERMEKYYRYSRGNYSTLMKEGQLGPDEVRVDENIFRFVGRFWKDAVLSDHPVFDYDGSDHENDFIAALKPNLMRAADHVMYNMIRYGCGVFVNNKFMMPQSVDPRFWYPVRQPDDLSEGMMDVIAYPYSAELANDVNQSNSRERGFEQGTGIRTPAGRLSNPEGIDLFPNAIAITVYDGMGQATKRQYRMDGMTVQEPISDQVMMQTGAPAVISVRQGGEDFYGLSDYEDIETFVAEMHNRESRLSIALDRHVFPHLAVPEGVIGKDQSGRATIYDQGSVIPVPEGAQSPTYVTWDANFSASENAMQRYWAGILRASRISPSVLSDTTISGVLRNIASGSALRRLTIVTVQRIRELREELTDGLKEVIMGQAAMSGIVGNEVYGFEKEKIGVKWPTELSGGLDDEAQAIATLVEAGVLEEELAIQLVSRVQRSEAEKIARKNEIKDRQSNPGSPQQGEVGSVSDGSEQRVSS